MPQSLSQDMLDRLASSWSRLDRARPHQRADVPAAISTLSEWMACALTVDDRLATLAGSPYLAARAEEVGGAPLLGLRHAALIVDEGHPLERIVVPSTGSPHVFWELHWRPDRELPACPEAREAYRLHLAGREVRTPAASMTTFLLAMAMAAMAAGPPEAEQG